MKWSRTLFSSISFELRSHASGGWQTESAWTVDVVGTGRRTDTDTLDGDGLGPSALQGRVASAHRLEGGVEVCSSPPQQIDEFLETYVANTVYLIVHLQVAVVYFRVIFGPVVSGVDQAFACLAQIFTRRHTERRRHADR